ncbi:unnamed protein product [Amoebophrya sp. A25]|nr:unnamed protein product [Amoebophrya sp. A25]|eukprot:GSA25T00005696001.1
MTKMLETDLSPVIAMSRKHPMDDRHAPSSSDAVRFRAIRGALYAVGNAIDEAAARFAPEVALSQRQNREKRDGERFHLTVISSVEIPIPIHGTPCPELVSMLEQEVAKPYKKKNEGVHDEASSALEDSSSATTHETQILSIDAEPYLQFDADAFFPIGLGRVGECSFVVVSFPRAQAFREYFGLPKKDFHITLGFGARGDLHDVPKNLHTLVHGSAGVKINRAPSLIPERMLALAAQRGVSESISSDLVAAVNALLNMQEETTSTDVAESKNEISATAATSSLAPHCRRLRALFHHTAAKLAGRLHRYPEVLQHAEQVLEIRSTDAEAIELKAFALFRVSGAKPCLEFVEEELEKMSLGHRAGETLQKLKTMCEKKLQSSSSAGQADIPTDFLAKKYPRTVHLKNLGAATDDDIVAKQQDEALFVRNGEVYLEEKIDGANIGFSLQDWQIRIQNRGHQVCSTTSAQFATIDTWVDEHRDALFSLLGNHNSTKNGAEQNNGNSPYVLYGEWCYLKHSVHYRRMPGHFVAFDLWDGTKFLSRKRFHAALQGTGIPAVPVVFKGELSSIRYVLETFMGVGNNAPCLSRFAPGEDAVPIEGLMLRKDDDKCGCLKHRMKMVRSEFQQGITQFWTRGKSVKQMIDFEFQAEWLATCYSEADLLPLEAETEDDLPAEGEEERQEQRVFGVLENGAVPKHETEEKSEQVDAASSAASAEKIAMKTNKSDVHPPRNKKKEEHSAFNGAPLNPRARVDSPFLNVHMMRNFSQLYPGVLVGSTPYTRAHIDALRHDYDVQLVITLTEETPLPEKWFAEGVSTLLPDGNEVPGICVPEDESSEMAQIVGAACSSSSSSSRQPSRFAPLQRETANGTQSKGKGAGKAEKKAVHANGRDGKNPKGGVTLLIEGEDGNDKQLGVAATNLYVPTPNYFPSSTEQIDGCLERIQAIVASGMNVFLHCGGGKGRAGTLAACCMLRFGLTGQQLRTGAASKSFAFPESAEAVRLLRAQRPGSIETDQQERFVRSYAQHLWAILPEDDHVGADHDEEAHTKESGLHDGAATTDALPAVTSLKKWKPSALQRTKSLQKEEEDSLLADLEALSGETQGKYPSTPYLPFSPSLGDSTDTALSHAQAAKFLRIFIEDSKSSKGAVTSTPQQNRDVDASIQEIIITEKLDGGNCCIKDGGRVFARTHAAPASHESFDPIRSMLRTTLIECGGGAKSASSSSDKAKVFMKPLLSVLQRECPASLELYGENLCARHSIEYTGGVCFPFYLFAVRLHGVWLSWEKTEQIARKLRLPLVPVRYRGPALGLNELERRMRVWAAEESLLVQEAKSMFCSGEDRTKRDVDSSLKFKTTTADAKLNIENENEKISATGDITGGKNTKGVQEVKAAASRNILPEGFVVRSAGETADLSSAMAKYVRANHIQTGPDYYRRGRWNRQQVLVESVTDFEDQTGRSYEPYTAARSENTGNEEEGSAASAARISCSNAQHAPGADAMISAGHVQEAGGQRQEPTPARTLAERGKSNIPYDILVLVGLPGSGKSTFVHRLRQCAASTGDLNVRVLCQDELGRAALENAVGAAFKEVDSSKKSARGTTSALGGNKKGLLVIDRCNQLVADRTRLLDLCFRPQRAACLHFEASAEECTRRVARRLDHPTVPFGRGATVVASFARRGFEPVNAQKEGFAAAFTLQTEADVDPLLRKWFNSSNSSSSYKPTLVGTDKNSTLHESRKTDALRNILQDTALTHITGAWPPSEAYWVAEENTLVYVHVHSALSDSFPREGRCTLGSLDRPLSATGVATNIGGGSAGKLDDEKPLRFAKDAVGVKVLFFDEYTWLDSERREQVAYAGLLDLAPLWLSNREVA